MLDFVALSRQFAKGTRVNELTKAENWAVKLAAEAAMGYYTEEELRLRSNLEPEIFEAVYRSPDFQAAVSQYRKEMQAIGSPVKAKASRMLWHSMDNLKDISENMEVPASDRIAAIREMARLAGEGAKEENGASATATIQIVQFNRDDLVAVQ